MRLSPTARPRLTRLLDAIPELAQLGAQPLDLQEALRAQRGIDLTFTELALLLGVERRAGMVVAGHPASDQVRALDGVPALFGVQPAAGGVGPVPTPARRPGRT